MRKRGPLLVSAAVIHRNGKILVGQRRKADRHSLKWEFPGGKVEYGETPQQALVRELNEELRIEAVVGQEIARYEHEYPTGASIHLLFFAVHSFSGALDAQVFEQISWRQVELLPELDFLEGDIDFVRRLARGEFRASLLEVFQK